MIKLNNLPKENITMGKIKMNEKGFSAVELIMVIIIIALIGVVGYLVHKDHQPAKVAATTKSTELTTAPSTANLYKVLPPATIASKTAECSQQLTTANDGSTGPITCSNGYLNVLEWNDLFKSDTPAFITLGYNATETQVQTAICSNLMNNNLDKTMVIEGNAYSIAALYYGWNFSTNPMTAVINSAYYNTGKGTC